MTKEQIALKRQELENAINELIEKFENETDTIVFIVPNKSHPFEIGVVLDVDKHLD